MTVLRAGEASLVGQVRPENQDNLVVAEDMQLFAVADGMGGHRGGEVASEVAATTLKASFTDKSTEGLAQAVQASNQAVVSTARDDSSLKGMGTTMCALALIEVDGAERLAVANVGDSRLYLLKAGTDQLVQITEDHSLVETLYRQGQLTKAEAEVHPHRNILTRALGIDADVLVDLFELLPIPGDRYLICSDGLFNEVTEEHMSIVLGQEPDPQRASDELARLADEAGGRDNITVVVVDVLAEEGQDPPAADPQIDRVVKVDRAAEQPLDFPTSGQRGGNGGATAPPSGPPTEPQPMTAGADGQQVPAEPPASVQAPPVVVQPSPVAAEPAPTSAPAAATTPAAPRTRFTWRVALFIVLFLAVVAAVVYSFVYFANNTYYVGFDGDAVAVYKGRPGGILFIKPSVTERTEINRADVPKASLDAIEKGKDEPSLADAEQYVQNLRDQIARQRQTLGGAVPPDSTTTTASSQPPGTSPPGAEGPVDTRLPTGGAAPGGGGGLVPTDGGDVQPR